MKFILATTNDNFPLLSIIDSILGLKNVFIVLFLSYFFITLSD